MPFQRRTLSELRDRNRAEFKSRLPGADATLRHSNLRVTSDVLAGLAHEHFGFQQYIAENVDPVTAQGEWLERWCLRYGLVRKGAGPAEGSVRFAGVNGIVIPEGTQLRRSDGREFATVAVATIAAGEAVVPVAALVGGTDGNTEAGAELNTLEALPGVNALAVVGAGGLIGGEDQEDDEAYRSRLLLRIRQPPHGGSRTDYEQWALEVPGVTRAWVYPREMGAGSVTIRFMMDETRENGIPNGVDGPAQADYTLDVLEVWNHIDAVRPVTNDVFVAKPIATPLAITIAGLSPATDKVKAAILAELKDMLRRRTQPGATIHRSWIWEAVSIATGEDHHTITVPSADVTHDPGEIAVLGTITYS